MSAPLILGGIWVVASAIVAMLPMKRQMVPGVALLLAAPVLLVWIAYVHGWVWLVPGLFAFVSMFRNPLRYFIRRALGLPAPLPKDCSKVMVPLALCLVWLIAANVVAMFPSRDKHWKAAYGLIAVGVPLLGWVTYEAGLIVGMVVLAAGASILRWPVVYLWRWLKRQWG